MRIKVNDKHISPSELLFEPEYYLFDFDTNSRQTRFLIVDEADLSLAPFVDIRFEPLAHGEFKLSLNKLHELLTKQTKTRPNSVYIFHHAFVCSTLLARCLNQIDFFFSLKEPWILRRLADFKRQYIGQMSSSQWQTMFSIYLSLLAKNYHSGETTLIKATNVANNLIEDLPGNFPQSKILYLYSDLPSFLISNLKKPEQTQKKIPGLVTDFLRDSDFSQQFPDFCKQAEKSFLRQCALLWVVNLYNFRQHTAGISNEMLRTLEMSDFLEQMNVNLIRLCHFFGHTPSQDDIKKMLDPEITQTNAKQLDSAYNKQKKDAETQLVLQHFHTEISMALQWATPLVKELCLFEYLQSLKLGTL